VRRVECCKSCVLRQIHEQDQDNASSLQKDRKLGSKVTQVLGQPRFSPLNVKYWFP
jgi:uncharacterized protein with ATP-grasp and redox domains